MLAFLAPAVLSAVILLVEFAAGAGKLQVIPTLVSGRPVLNLVLAILAYLPVGAVVPIALFLLSRTGDTPRSLRLGWPLRWSDLGMGLGLAAGGYGTELLIIVVIEPFLRHNHVINAVSIGHVPGYYVIYGLVLSAVTSVTEEVLVNAYLLTRLQQLGWRPWPALALSLVLRTSYHVYYGVGFLLTVPLGYYITRSFQKHRSLNRAIAAHFIYDATIFTLAILVHP